MTGMDVSITYCLPCTHDIFDHAGTCSLRLRTQEKWYSLLVPNHRQNCLPRLHRTISHEQGTNIIVRARYIYIVSDDWSSIDLGSIGRLSGYCSLWRCSLWRASLGRSGSEHRIPHVATQLGWSNRAVNELCVLIIEETLASYGHAMRAEMKREEGRQEKGSMNRWVGRDRTAGMVEQAACRYSRCCGLGGISSRLSSFSMCLGA